MSRKNTQTLKNIRSLCRMQDLDEKSLYMRSRLLLSVYRDACWSTCGRADEVQEELVWCCGNDLDAALIYLETFAPDEEKQHFEHQIRTLFETRWMMELVESAMAHLREYPGNGAQYFEILSKCYLSCFKYREAELLEVLNMERSVYYDRKKEAILLFGLSMWNTSIPRLKTFLADAAEEEALMEEEED